MKISLVLGSGGARGYAHIGVINELEARGHEVVAVAGASIGALIGGAYATGRLDELTEAALGLSRTDLWMLLQPRLGAPGLIKSTRIMALLRKVIGDARIEDLPLPYTAVATDLLAHREIWFHEGPLLAAIRASIAVPSVFTPVVIQGRLLCDGGLVNPLPMETSLRLDADLTVAVSLFGRDPAAHSSGAITVSSDSQDEQTPRGWLHERLEEAWPSRNRRAREEGFEPLPEGLDLANMVTMSLDIMQARIQASRVAVNPPDVHIEVPANLCALFDFAEAKRVIEVGRELAVAKFDEAGL